MNVQVVRNISKLYSCAENRAKAQSEYVETAALVIQNDAFSWLGAEKDLPPEYQQTPSLNANQKILVPGLIDCHTHLAFGGWRADEFKERCLGTTYLEIAQRGGGILNTMQQTRKVNEDALFERTKIFLRQMSARGVTTVEAKSGYGLSVEAELKQLRVYKRLQQEAVTRVVPTFLGAHTIPPEFKQKRTEYIDILCEQLLPQVAEQNLAKFCDVFCEVSAFSIEESRRILTRATNLGLKLKLHADQLSSFGAAELAADVGAISADHLEYASDAGLHAMAAHGVMPVLLPIATLYTREKWARMERFRKAGLPVAFASDFNPGSAPSFSLELVMLLACTQNGASPYEALQGVTINAARALQLQESIGSIEVGKLADFALIDALSVEEWISHFNPSREISVFKSGKLL